MSVATTVNQPKSDTDRASFLDIPPEILLEHLLPVLADKELATLSAVNKNLHAICNTESLWSRRIAATFPFSPTHLAPPSSTSGWSKRVYIGLSRPRPFIWGSSENGRLGVQDDPDYPAHGQAGTRRMWSGHPANTPVDASGQFERVRRRLGAVMPDSANVERRGRTWVEALRESMKSMAERIVSQGGDGSVGTGVAEEGQMIQTDKGTGIVELEAGGWSFAARDMDGLVWVWGQLDGTGYNLRSEGWHDKFCQVPEPTPIPLPCRAEAISMGRNHMLVLDQDNLIWELRAYGRAYHHTSHLLTSPSNPGSTTRPHHIIQLATGWSHSACLTSSGRIMVWYPFSQEYTTSLRPEDQLHGPLGVAEDDSRALKWGTVGDVVHELEPLPARPGWDEVTYPVIPGEGPTRREIEADWEAYEKRVTERERVEGEKIVKIACGSDFVVALRGSGEVWFWRVAQNQAHTQWEYLPYFSSPSISHISAQFASLTSYSTSSNSSSTSDPSPRSRINHASLPSNVGRQGWTESFLPDHLQGFQDKDVIQVAIGDYHFAALTSRGEMYTWGQGDAGQLGLNRQGMAGARVVEPKKVQFPTSAQGEEAFVFAITAAGWHTGALVLGDVKRVAANSGKADTEARAQGDLTSTQGSWGGGGGGSGGGAGGRYGNGTGWSPNTTNPQPSQPSIFRVGFAGRDADHMPGGFGPLGGLRGALGATPGFVPGSSPVSRQWRRRDDIPREGDGRNVNADSGGQREEGQPSNQTEPATSQEQAEPRDGVPSYPAHWAHRGGAPPAFATGRGQDTRSQLSIPGEDEGDQVNDDASASATREQSASSGTGSSDAPSASAPDTQHIKQEHQREQRERQFREIPRGGNRWDLRGGAAPAFALGRGQDVRSGLTIPEDIGGDENDGGAGNAGNAGNALYTPETQATLQSEGNVADGPEGEEAPDTSGLSFFQPGMHRRLN